MIYNPSSFLVYLFFVYLSFKLVILFVLFYLIKLFYDENDNQYLFRIKGKDGHIEEEDTK
jgi:hypothetical protein